jgi:predicted transcriptional regulator
LVLPRARRRANLTQAKLVQRIGVLQSIVVRIEGSIGSRKYVTKARSIESPA